MLVGSGKNVLFCGYVIFFSLSFLLSVSSISRKQFVAHLLQSSLIQSEHILMMTVLLNRIDPVVSVEYTSASYLKAWRWCEACRPISFLLPPALEGAHCKALSDSFPDLLLGFLPVAASHQGTPEEAGGPSNHVLEEFANEMLCVCVAFSSAGAVTLDDDESLKYQRRQVLSLQPLSSSKNIWGFLQYRHHTEKVLSMILW